MVLWVGLPHEANWDEGNTLHHPLETWHCRQIPRSYAFNGFKNKISESFANVHDAGDCLQILLAYQHGRPAPLKWLHLSIMGHFDMLPTYIFGWSPPPPGSRCSPSIPIFLMRYVRVCKGTDMLRCWTKWRIQYWCIGWMPDRCEAALERLTLAGNIRLTCRPQITDSSVGFFLHA